MNAAAASPCAVWKAHTPTYLFAQAGALAAFTIDLLVYPLDTLKTRWQSQDYIDTFKKPGSSAAKNAQRQTFRGLYQGVGSVIVATLPAGE